MKKICSEKEKKKTSVFSLLPHPHPRFVLYHKLQISGIEINEVFTVFSQIMQ